MRCSNCSFENAAGRRFCSSCGKPLASECASCGFSNSPGDSFCGGCGAALSKPAGGPVVETADVATARRREGERRPVTILFADLCRFTELTQERDSEEVHKLLGRYFEGIDRVVVNYGGRIDKHIGDAVMAVFGAPVAHDNDPVRAVRAAADIHGAVRSFAREIGLDLQVHIGIASGQVLASDLGSSAHQEYAVTGLSVNLAARLVAKAAPGETLISDAVYRSVADIVAVDSLGELPVKGFDRPVRVWRISAYERDGIGRAETPFVGRTPELRQFQSVLDYIGEAGTGQVIYLRGEAGMGKSRLTRELASRAAKAGFACHSGLFLDFGIGEGKDAVREVFRDLLGIAESAESAERVQALDGAVEEGLIDAAQAVFARDLLDLPQASQALSTYDAMNNESRHRGKQSCVAGLVERLCRRRPLAIVIEDLHWAEPHTLGYLAALAAVTVAAPFLLIMTARPEGDPLDSAWRQAAERITMITMDVGPLRPAEARAFAEGFVDATNRYALNCIERAEGNPLFLEQLLRSASAGEEDVPSSVQSIVMSRVDRLSPSDKLALQAAAVLGQRFSPEVLRYLLDVPEYSCAALLSGSLLRTAGDDYLFAHALIWESVYGSLLREQRRGLHARAARWFAERDLQLHAAHLDRAGEPGAASAYCQAARQQAQAYHFERALQSVERGLAVASSAQDRFDLLSLKGEHLRELGRAPESIVTYRAALKDAQTATQRCDAMIGLAAGMRITDEFDEALQLLDRAEDLARENNLELQLSQTHYYRGSLFFPQGNIEGCQRQHQLALDHARRAGSPESEARALSGLGDALYSQGRMVTAFDYFQRCIELSRTHGFGRIEVSNLYMVAWTRLYMNDVEGALRDGLQATSMAERVNHQRAEMVARLTIGRLLVESGEPAAAEPHVLRGLELASALGANRFRPFLMIYQARLLCARTGPQPGLVELMRQAYDLSKQTGIGFLGPWVLSTLARVTDDPAQARAWLREGQEVLDSRGCVGHNYFAFYPDAIAVSLRLREWAAAEAYAAKLMEFSASEPLPWADFFAKCGRVAAAFGRDGTAAARSELTQTKFEAERLRLGGILPLIEDVLAVRSASAGFA